ncbi:hypothetical protein V8F20_012652 [Naviculisporaceae sp. PSN 640]
MRRPRRKASSRLRRSLVMRRRKVIARLRLRQRRLLLLIKSWELRRRVIWRVIRRSGFLFSFDGFGGIQFNLFVIFWLDLLSWLRSVMEMQ